jgi:cytochrome c556
VRTIPELLRVIPFMAFGFAPVALSQGTDHSAHMAQQATPADGRQVVNLPEPMRRHMLANMRDHLRTLQEINDALANNAFDKASSIAEKRLGMSSLDSHGAAHLAPYLPQGMQDIGTQMHRAASRLSVAAQDAGVGNDVRPALGALGAVMQQCVACHETYRVK